MASIFVDYWKILILSKEPYSRVKDSDSGFSYSVGLFLVLALIISLGTLVGLRDIGTQPNLAESLGRLSTQAQALAAQLPEFLSTPLNDIASTLGSISASIIQSQPPLGKNVSEAIRLVGGWLETPFTLLGVWMGAGLGIWLVALLMGGGASLRQHLSLLLLAFAPQILNFFRYLPAGTGLPGWATNFLWCMAAIWSLAIAVNSLSIAHSIERSKALLVILASMVVFLAVIPLLLALIAGIVLSLVF